MESIKEKSIRFYADLASRSQNKVEVSGRYVADAEKEQFIWSDIQAKLRLGPSIGSKAKIFDIGCGFSNIAINLLDYSLREECELWLMDIPEIIASLQADIKKPLPQSINFISGFFPEDFKVTKHFNYILIYSVLHYSDEPLALVESAINLLAPGGRLLVGDIPNVNKKGRFLSSESGRKFDADYKQVPIESINKYPNHFAYAQEQSSEVNLLDDDLILNLISKYRRLGFGAYVLPQPSNLPFCYTREDLLFVRYD